MEAAFFDKEYPTRGPDGQLTGGRTVIRYALDGKEVARIGYDASGRETFRQEVTTSVNNNGHEKTVSTFTTKGSLLQKSVTRFNKEGKLAEILVSAANGKLIDHQIYIYSDDTVSYSHFNEDEQLIESWSRCITGVEMTR